MNAVQTSYMRFVPLALVLALHTRPYITATGLNP